MPGVSDQYALIYCTKVPVLTCLGGGGRPKDQRSSKVPYGLGTMLALFFALGRFLRVLLSLMVVFGASWALRARFLKGSGLVLEGFLLGFLG